MTDECRQWGCLLVVEPGADSVDLDRSIVAIIQLTWGARSKLSGRYTRSANKPRYGAGPRTRIITCPADPACSMDKRGRWAGRGAPRTGDWAHGKIPRQDNPPTYSFQSTAPLVGGDFCVSAKESLGEDSEEGKQ